MLWNRVLFSLVCAFSVRVSAEELPLSLEAAVALALQTAPQVDGRVASAEAARALASSAGRLPDPELIVGVDNLPVSGPDAYSTTRDFMTMRKVGVMQTFPNGTRRRLERARADALVGVADAELVESRLEIAREAASAWIERAAAEAALNELGVLKPELELQAAAARAAVAAGRASTAEALAAETAIAQLVNRVLRMQSQARRSALELARWIDVDANRPLTSMPSFDELPTPPAALLASVHEHGSLLPFGPQLETARIDVDLAKAQRRPDFSAELAFAKRGAEFSDMVSLQFRIGLPLFTTYRQEPLISARHAQLRQLEAEREAQVRMHTTELREMLDEWEALGLQLDQYEQELMPLLRDRSRAALASYRAGRGELRLALDAYQQEIEAVIERAQLQNERGRVWAFLRYIGPEHLHR